MKNETKQLHLQHTLSAPFTLLGVGVHSGASATLIARPAAADTGIVFMRSDITDRDNRLPARWDMVADTRLCTVLKNAAGVTVATIEHIMAAFVALGIDNAEVSIDGPEIPIMDGSSADFIRAIDSVGRVALSAPRRALKIRKPVHIKDGDKEVFLSPADEAFFSFEIMFDNPLIGRQKFSHRADEAHFRSDIAFARTFGFLHEVEALRAMGLARGGSLDNAIVIDGDTVMNPDGLRSPTEFVRHKILDAIGDIGLAGFPLLGHYHGVKAGHAMNNKALIALFADADAWEMVELTATQPQVSAPVRLNQPVRAHMDGVSVLVTA